MFALALAAAAAPLSQQCPRAVSSSAFFAWRVTSTIAPPLPSPAATVGGIVISSFSRCPAAPFRRFRALLPLRSCASRSGGAVPLVRRLVPRLRRLAGLSSNPAALAVVTPSAVSVSALASFLVPRGSRGGSFNLCVTLAVCSSPGNKLGQTRQNIPSFTFAKNSERQNNPSRNVSLAIPNAALSR